MKISRKEGLKRVRIVEHNKKLLWWIFALVIILIIVLISIKVINNKESNKEKQDDLQIANPASVFCLNNSGELILENLRDGSQIGTCRFKDGSQCEEWAFFRGECKKGDSLNSNYNSNACSIDSDCVAASCCHADSCVNKNFAPDCAGTMCTMECKPNTLDCNQASCKCLSGKCGIEFK